MNWHFTFVLLDIAVWIGIALISTHIFRIIPHKSSVGIVNTLIAIIITLGAGFISVLVHGLPDVGFSTNSFGYAFLVAFSFALYKQVKKKKLLIKVLHVGQHVKNISSPNLYKGVKI